MYTRTDIAITNDGDLYFNENDILTVNGFDFIIQQILKILRTTRGELSYAPNLGVDLDSFAGKPNTREISNELKYEITEAIKYSFPFEVNYISVKIVPLSSDSISIYILMSDNTTTKVISKLIYDYTNGIIKTDVNASDNKPEYYTEFDTNIEEPINEYLNLL